MVATDEISHCVLYWSTRNSSGNSIRGNCMWEVIMKFEWKFMWATTWNKSHCLILAPVVTCHLSLVDTLQVIREGENFTFPVSPTTDISCSFLLPSANMQRSSIPLEPLSNSTITYALSIISGTWTQNLVNKCLAKKKKKT